MFEVCKKNIEQQICDRKYRFPYSETGKTGNQCNEIEPRRKSAANFAE